eukprot:comp15527_c0_seq1/m.12561 comp15527_c0_seq1/g.12561  ORF comp15527_c0_seq1/g.12561 comp15527_c0_seq1/m.12561 type:complete len:349 (-) comp15527_c0_seq1:169-1215(-)
MTSQVSKDRFNFDPHIGRNGELQASQEKQNVLPTSSALAGDIVSVPSQDGSLGDVSLPVKMQVLHKEQSVAELRFRDIPRFMAAISTQDGPPYSLLRRLSWFHPFLAGCVVIAVSLRVRDLRDFIRYGQPLNTATYIVFGFCVLVVLSAHFTAVTAIRCGTLQVAKREPNFHELSSVDKKEVPRDCSGGGICSTLVAVLNTTVTTLLFTFFVCTGLCVIIIPGLLALEMFCLAPAAAVVEGLNPFRALARSWQLTSKHGHPDLALFCTLRYLPWALFMAACLGGTCAALFTFEDVGVWSVAYLLMINLPLGLCTAAFDLKGWEADALMFECHRARQRKNDRIEQMIHV